MCGASSQGGRSDQAPATGLREVVRPCPWVDVSAQCWKVKEVGDLTVEATGAPMNGSRNYNDSKVAKFLVG